MQQTPAGREHEPIFEQLKFDSSKRPSCASQSSDVLEEQVMGQGENKQYGGSRKTISPPGQVLLSALQESDILHGKNWQSGNTR